MSLNIVYDALLSRLPNSRRTPSGFHNINGPCCAHRGHRPDRRKRGGIKFDGFSVIYSCFNCGFKTGWAPGGILTVKMNMLLAWTGVSGDTIKEIQFWSNEFRYRQSMGGARAITPDGMKSLADWADNNCTDPRFLEIATFLQSDDPPRDLKDWYWTPEDNGFSAPTYAISLEGDLSYPLSWYAIPVLDTSLPAWTNKGPDDEPVGEELTDEQWKVLEDEFNREFGS